MESFGLTLGIGVQWIDKLMQALRTARGARRDQFDALANVFGDPIELARLYVHPDCQQFNPADDAEEAASVVREPVFRRLDAFFGGEARRLDRVLFVLSDAGMGKTSLLVMLKLAHLSSFWPQEYDCVLLKLGEGTLDRLAEVPSPSRTVVLLDALDEDPTAWGRVTTRISDVLRATVGFRRVVLTCRTQFFSAGDDPFNRGGKVQVAGLLCPVVYLSLFSLGQTREYLGRLFEGRKDREEVTSKALEIVTRMGSLKFRPMLLAHIEDFLESEVSAWNQHTIFDALVTAWLLREQRKQLARNQEPPRVSDLRKACVFLAVHLQNAGLREIGEDDLSTLIDEAPAVRHVSRMEITGRSLLNKNSLGDYRFSHYSIQEYLAVEGMVRGEGNVSTLRPTAQMLAFLSSRLGSGDRGALSVSLRRFRLENAKLEGVNLTGLDLSVMVLDGANLRGATLDGVKLQAARLEGADLTGASVVGADLRRAHARRACFREADLRDARLEEAWLQGADLRGADLRGARTKGANVQRARYDGDTKFPKYMNLNGARYTAAT